MRNLLVLFLIGSEFYLIFAFWINSSLILLPLLCTHQIVCLCRSVSEVEKAQLLHLVMNSRYSRWICISAISSGCNVYFMLAELNGVLDQLRHFCGTFPRFFGTFPHYSVFSWVEAVMTLMLPILGLLGAVPRLFSFSLFIACIV